MRLTLKTSSFESFTGGGAADDDVLPRFLLSPTILSAQIGFFFYII
jgi:hypothetical protein